MQQCSLRSSHGRRPGERNAGPAISANQRCNLGSSVRPVSLNFFPRCRNSAKSRSARKPGRSGRKGVLSAVLGIVRPSAEHRTAGTAAVALGHHRHEPPRLPAGPDGDHYRRRLPAPRDVDLPRHQHRDGRSRGQAFDLDRHGRHPGRIFHDDVACTPNLLGANLEIDAKGETSGLTYIGGLRGWYRDRRYRRHHDLRRHRGRDIHDLDRPDLYRKRSGKPSTVRSYSMPPRGSFSILP